MTYDVISDMIYDMIYNMIYDMMIYDVIYDMIYDTGCLNKAFVGLGSCDNVQAERSIFEYANWFEYANCLADPSIWSV